MEGATPQTVAVRDGDVGHWSQPVQRQSDCALDDVLLKDVVLDAAEDGRVRQWELLQGAVDADAFDPKTAEDARRRVLAAIAQRQGQPEFRKKLMAAYGSRCPISNCDFLEALEAAHILAYRGPETNHVQNGILLRADLHTLFDRGLIGVNQNCRPSAAGLLDHIKASEYLSL